MTEPEEGSSKTMSKEEEEEMERLVQQRRGARSSAFYQKPILPVEKVMPASSGQTEPGSTKDTGGKILQHSSRIKIGYGDTIGRTRATMEDEICIVGTYRGKIDEDFIGIFDGHGGRNAAEFAAKKLHEVLSEKLNKNIDAFAALEESFLDTNEQFKAENTTGGTTALVSYISGNKCYIANAGDCRAVVGYYSRNGEENLLKTKRITTDHKPDHPDELKRIREGGGYVTINANKVNGKTISRVNGMLAVSRALGDTFLQPHVSAKPEVFVVDIDQDQLWGGVLILACDGVWDVVEDDEAVKAVIVESEPEAGAVKLRDLAITKQSTDNVSVVVIHFPALQTNGNHNTNTTTNNNNNNESNSNSAPITPPQITKVPSAEKPVPSPPSSAFSFTSPALFGITLVASVLAAWYFNR